RKNCLNACVCVCLCVCECVCVCVCVCVCCRPRGVRAGPGRPPHLQSVPLRRRWHHGGLHLLDGRHLRSTYTTGPAADTHTHTHTHTQTESGEVRDSWRDALGSQ